MINAHAKNQPAIIVAGAILIAVADVKIKSKFKSPFGDFY
jgi:hypothetical protein